MEPNDECPDFDDTLRNMLGTPPVRHPRSEKQDDARGPEDEAQDDESDG